jgi:phage/plasmid-like protein (TIGR03299 family)
MSAETIEWLNQNTLIGFTATRGKAWHFSAAEQGVEPNHYPGPIPREDVVRRLFPWEIVKVPLTVTVPVTDFDVATGLNEDGQMVRTYVIEDRVATVRSDSGAHLGITSPTYEPHQYGPWLIDELGAILDVSDFEIGSAVLLKGGSVAAVQIECPEGVSFGGDEHRPFITAATSADGSLATVYRTGATRVVCDNTLDAALRERTSSEFKLRHTSKSANRLGEARAALEIAYTQLDQFAADVERLMNTPVSPMEFQMVRNMLLPLPAEKGNGYTRMQNRRDSIEGIYSRDGRVGVFQGTAWGVLQAFNTYRQHEATIRKSTDRAEKNRMALLTGETGTADRKVLAAVSKAKGVPVLA